MDAKRYLGTVEPDRCWGSGAALGHAGFDGPQRADRISCQVVATPRALAHRLKSAPRTDRLNDMLRTLAALGQAHPLEDGRYAARNVYVFPLEGLPPRGTVVLVVTNAQDQKEVWRASLDLGQFR